MDVVMTIARVLAAIVEVYGILVILRIFMSWMPGLDIGAAGSILGRITDPFLRLFSGIKFLRIGRFNFAILLGFLFLQFIQAVLNYVAIGIPLTLGLVLATLVAGFMYTLGGVLLLLIVLIAVRLVGMFIRVPSIIAAMIALDSILQPLAGWLMSKLFPNRVLPYGTMLVLWAIVLVVLRIASDVLLGALANLALKLPI